MMRMLMGVLALALSGCATVPAESEPVPPVHGAGSCDAVAAQKLVGQAATVDLAAKAQRLSGAEMVRWLRPGQMVTMEFREGRLNIQLDEQNRVIAIRCG
jgi:positive regulator of sigma E activity